MGRRLSTYESDTGKGYCEVHMNFKDEFAYIKYFDNTGKQFYVEEFPGDSIKDVTSTARQWAEGYYTLFED